MKRLTILALALSTLLSALPGHAQSASVASSASAIPSVPTTSDPEWVDPRLARGFRKLNRPFGIAEFGVGWLTLPGAAVCAERSTLNCKKGDTSFELDAWQLYRGSRRFAFGAGLLLGLIPTTNAQRAISNGIERAHSRSYLTLEGMFRHYPYVGESVELWWGLSGGVVVVNDRFVVTGKNTDLALVGQRGVTIRSEGWTFGLVGGAVFWLAENWSMGTTFRYGNWYLPKTAAKDPLLDEASVSGRSTMFSLGISLNYRIPL